MTSSEDMEMSDMMSDEGLEDDEETGLTSRDRQKRRRRKRRNTQLGQRIVPDEGSMRKEEEKLARKSFWAATVGNAVLIGLWYLFSISITVYNKWMFKEEDGKQKIVFPFPLFTTCVHMMVQFSLASLVLFLMPRFRPRQGVIDSHNLLHPQTSRDGSHAADLKKPLMTKWFYFTRIGPCGAATGLDIGLGNMSLRFISMTFYTMCKSSVLGFVLIFAFLFRLEKPSWKLLAIITTMTIGVVMMVAGETAFDVLGFILVMSAAASSGFRWSLTQILLLRNPATSNPFSSIFFLAPIMFVTLLVIAIPVEGFVDLYAAFQVLASVHGTLLSIGILLFPGCLAFAMTASEFALLQRTSVVTLSICGIFKEVLTISTATIVFDDKLTLINFTGLLVTIATIAAYNYIKMKQMREDAQAAAHLAVEQEYAPVLLADPDRVRGLSPKNEARRTSTGELIRSSLSMPVGGSSVARPGSDSPTRQSPIKRPEDLE
ncbi:TPT-domain-containing protein [Trichodelitschia bisporula]|uniref:TPT-domain-containing protein n=1 Tax=Trichodelitschia bisporula TaxID=703511 RepID=A0A6G1I2A9_9PEZI|nr:TPT-domain-containing protein [Trichodelitschia bisporula]